MKQNLIINLIFLILIFQIIQANDQLFGDRSIIRRLKNQLGSFISEIKIKNELPINNNQLFKEEYNFKDKSGRFHHSKSTINLYLDDLSEYYFINENLYCYSTTHYRLIYSHIRHYLIKWAPKQTINLSRSFEVLGPSHFLFALISDYDENKENINCVNINDNADIRCDIIFDESAKIEYYFKDDNQLKMYPIKIRTFKKLSNKDEYELYNEINYIKFIYSFNGDFNRISPNLPMNINCQRFHDDYQNKYPHIMTDFSNRFKLEYDIEFNYLDLKNKDNETFLKRKYNGKWFRDDLYKFNIIDAVDEETNRHLRTYYDSETRICYDVYDDGKCNRYNLKYGFNYTLNWFYFQDLILHPNLFNIEDDLNKFSYLGEYELEDKKIYYTFEKNYLLHYSKVSDYGRKNNNRIYPNKIIILHYYHPSNNKIPKLIQLNYFNYNGKYIGTTKIKIKKHNLVELTSDNFNEKIDFDNCFKNMNPSTDYKELNVAFKGNSKLFNENYIKYEFRKLIDGYSTKRNLLFSPLRIYDIKLDLTDNLLNITAKLLKPINSLNYFNTIKNLTLDESKEKTNNELIRTIKGIDNKQLCSRLCIQEKHAAAFSFESKNRICKLWIDSKFNGDIDNRNGYNWNKVKTKLEIDSILGKRYIRFYFREHISIKNILNLIKKSINKKQFNLILKKNSNTKETKLNYFVRSNLNKKSKYRFLIYFIVFILIIISLIVGIIKYRKRNKINESNYPIYVNFRNTK